MRAYDKLVRDKVVKAIRSRGEMCAYHYALAEEYPRKLFEKLLEEIAEFLKKPSEEEMADILEVLDAFGSLFGLNKRKVAKIKIAKAEEKGKFRKKIILDKA